MVICSLSIPLVSLERAFRCPCRELSNSILTLLVRCGFEVLVAISCVSWLLVDASLLAIPSVPISVCVFFFHLNWKYDLHCLGL